MIIFICIVVVLFLLGIILLTGKSAHRKISREQYLEDLAKFLETEIEPIEDGVSNNSFQIRFKYGGVNFVYQDLEKPSFKEKVYYAHLKAQISSDFSITFTERKRSMKVRTDIFLSSDYSTEGAGNRAALHVPAHLKDMEIYTNDTITANYLFDDRKVSALFKRLKNTDIRGYSSLPIEVTDGLVRLTFASDTSYTPNLDSLKADIPSIEDYADKILLIVRKVTERM